MRRATQIEIKLAQVSLEKWSSWEDWTQCYGYSCSHHAERPVMSVNECRRLKNLIEVIDEEK